MVVLVVQPGHWDPGQVQRLEAGFQRSPDWALKSSQRALATTPNAERIVEALFVCIYIYIHTYMLSHIHHLQPLTHYSPSFINSEPWGLAATEAHLQQWRPACQQAPRKPHAAAQQHLIQLYQKVLGFRGVGFHVNQAFRFPGTVLARYSWMLCKIAGKLPYRNTVSLAIFGPCPPPDGLVRSRWQLPRRSWPNPVRVCRPEQATESRLAPCDLSAFCIKNGIPELELASV